MTMELAFPRKSRPMPEIVVMPWFRKEDWARWRRLLADGHRLPFDFRVWEFRVETVRIRLQRDGRRVNRIFMDPEIFIEWCRARGVSPCADTGWRFAAEANASRH